MEAQLAAALAPIAELKAELAALKARSAQKSSNSSRPPSSDPPRERLVLALSSCRFVAADDFGEWVGQHQWRSVAGAERRDAVQRAVTADRLNASMTTGDCYQNMPRAH